MNLTLSTPDFLVPVRLSEGPHPFCGWALWSRRGDGLHVGARLASWHHSLGPGPAEGEETQRTTKLSARLNSTWVTYVIGSTARCSLQVEDPQFARLIDGRILIGRDKGMTTIQVDLLIFVLIANVCCVTCNFSNSRITFLIPFMVHNMALSLLLVHFLWSYKPHPLTCYTNSHN